METDTIRHARRIWNYLASFKDESRCDAIIVCCSYDIRVCDYACELVRSGMSDKLILSGKTGRWTGLLWGETEARVFFERAKALGIDEKGILVEERSTNLGENISESRKLIPGAKSVVFVTKPNTILRVRLTAPVQWPEVKIHTGCPDIKFPDEVSNVVGLFGVISEMVGDIQRILEYPVLGYQLGHELPYDIIESWEYLKGQGFNQHMLNNMLASTRGGVMVS